MKCVYVNPSRREPGPKLREIVATPVGWLGVALLIAGFRLIGLSERIAK